MYKGNIKVGDRFESKRCGWFVVIEANSIKDIVIKFEQTGYITTIRSQHTVTGRVKDRLHPTVFSVGFLGEGTYRVKVEGKLTKEYTCWKGMLTRCYYAKFQDKYPTYKGCSVCEDWHNFQNFAKYYENNYKDGYHLDKDLLFKGNKVYSPKTCIFVPPKFNSFMLGHGAKRGKHKVGVYLYSEGTSPYRASISNNTGKIIHLGHFTTEEEAYQAWLSNKLQQALEYKPEMDIIDDRIYPTVVDIIKEM